MARLLSFIKDPSLISLFISNLLVIFLALFQNWDIVTILWVYWMQSVVIGFFQFLRILSLNKFSTENFKINNQPAAPTDNTKLFTAFFFAFHYGFFHFVYAIFLFNFFTSKTSDFGFLFVGGLVFFINHTYSYFHNRIIDQQKVQNIGTLVFTPYARIIPMHLIIITGVILGQFTLIIFLLLKTIVDLAMHRIKHRIS